MGKKVLVIDDDVELVDQIVAHFENEGYAVVGVFDGQDGLEVARIEKPDLIVLDIILPKVYGFDLLNQLKQDKITQSIPVIVITQYSGFIGLLKKEEVADYLIKPFTPEKLYDRVRRQIGEIRRKKILIIDADINTVSILDLRLRTLHYAVVTADNGRDGLEKVKKEKPDLIILDSLIPGIDIYEFWGTLKKESNAQEIPLVVLTSRPAERDFFETIGADEIALKPFDAWELIDRIKFLLLNRVMILCHDHSFADTIAGVIRERSYEVDIVDDEETMLKKSKENRYKIIIAYLPSIKKEPDAFVAELRSSKCKNAGIFIYSNSRVKGTEKDNVAVIRDIKRKWIKGKADAFYDRRDTEFDLSELLDRYLGKENKYGFWDMREY